MQENHRDELVEQVKAIDLELCLLAKQQQALVARLHQLNQAQSEAGNRRTASDRRSGQDRRHRKQAKAVTGSAVDSNSPNASGPDQSATRSKAGRRAPGNDRRQELNVHYMAVNKELAAVIERNETLIAQWNKLTGNDGSSLDLQMAPQEN